MASHLRIISDYEKSLEEVCLHNRAETEANLFGLEKKLKVEDTEMDQMEATYCANIIVLEKELEEAKLRVKQKTKCVALRIG